MVTFYRFDLRQLFISGTFFWAGAVAYHFDLKRHLSITTVVIAIGILMSLEGAPPQLGLATFVLFPLVVLAFGLAYSPILWRLTSTGDYSYGIYIYAFPVQQAVVQFAPKMPLLPYIGLCTGLTLVLAVASWHLVERRALMFRPRK